MAKVRTRARCSACDHTEPRWVGRCPSCGAWGTIEEERVDTGADGVRPPRRVGSGAKARPIRDVPADAHDRLVTGADELDRVLGGGFVPGSATLLGGEPGAGKSTLLLQTADALAATGRKVLYVSAEESVGQVRMRADRLGALDGGVLLASEGDLPAIVDLVAEHEPALLIVDSIQTVRDPDLGGVPGGTGQVRECGAALVGLAKSSGMAAVLVGHVTKEGTIAGPRVLEHLVDTVVEMEGDRHHALRLTRATKNRYGATGEVGCFEMTGEGLVGVADAGRLFVGDADGASGVAISLALEGSRPMACEVQALVSPSPLANPRRAASGLDTQRLHLLAAVLERRAGVDLGNQDLYVSTVGGLRLTEPAVDLALCLAIASSWADQPVSQGLVAFGEVGLAGELRLVAQTERRLSEAARLGFTRALLPHAYDGSAFGLSLERERDLRGALARVLPSSDAASGVMA